MKRIILRTLILCFFMCSAIFIFSACSNEINKEYYNNSEAEIVSTKDFNMEGNNGRMVLPCSETTYSFIDKIQVSTGATWAISTDIYGINTIITKTISLEEGDNIIYLLVTSGDGSNINLYTLTIRRRPVYTVTFNTGGATTVETQRIEEESFAVEPTLKPTKSGYNFAGWNYDFTKPIMNNTMITAQWSYYTLTTAVNDNKAGSITTFTGTKITTGESVTLNAITNAGYTFIGWYNGETKITTELSFTFIMPNENLDYTAKWLADINTPYKVEYYLENANDNNYTLQESDTEIFVGTTDTIATVEVNKTYEHFTYNANKSVLSGNINGNGSTVLKVYYTRDTCKISITADMGVILNNTYDDDYKYGYIIPDITAKNYLGYEWQGWYNDDEFMTINYTIPSFTVDKSIKYVAKQGAVKDEMLNFDFSANATTCIINGIKNKTVTNIMVPDYVTGINEGAFNGCASLERITIPFVGGGYYGEGRWNSFGYIFGLGQYVGGVAITQYYRPNASAQYYIPSKLNEVTVTGGYILYGAFQQCSNLTDIIIPDSIISIGECAFQGCSSLTNINIPESVVNIGNRAFQNCSNFKRITIPNSVENIGDAAFYGCGITSITIPGGVIGIGRYVFANCSSLQNITLPNSVISIGDESFRDCNNLRYVYYKGTAIEWSKVSIGSYNYRLTNATRYYYSETAPTESGSGNYWHYVEGKIVVW